MQHLKASNSMPLKTGSAFFVLFVVCRRVVRYNKSVNKRPTKAKPKRTKMAGYDGYSMSNNARDAYANGEKPLSKWSKKDIINIVGAGVINRNPELKALTLKELRAIFLTQTAWHHTSKFYNETNFYACQTIEEIAEDPDACAIDVAVTWPHFPMGDDLTQESPEVIDYNEKREMAIAETHKLQDIVDAIAEGTIK